MKISVAREKCVDSENLDWGAACDSGNKSSEQRALPAGYELQNLYKCRPKGKLLSQGYRYI